MRFLQAGEPGSTNVLVLAHAFPVGARLFGPQLGAFAGWRVIAPAMPGFDGSARLDQPSIDAYARQVLGLLDELGVGHAVVGGVSMGGHFTFAMLRQAPERVVGAVFADTRSAADTEEALAARRQLLQVAAEAGALGVAADMVPKLLGPTTQARRPAVVAAVRGWIEDQDVAGITDAITVLMTRPDSTPMLGSIRVPSLVVVGEEDALAPVAEMERMAAAIPGATFVTIAGAGHLANLEDPGAFNNALQDFLEAIRIRN